jgi:nucleoside-diphosphate-sugar epimerase
MLTDRGPQPSTSTGAAAGGFIGRSAGDGELAPAACHERPRTFVLVDGTSEKGVAMKVFVAGATGALGKQLVPLLVARGHDVVGMTRTASKRDQLHGLGAQPVVADALDAEAVRRAVGQAAPDVIVHELTAIPAAINMRRFGREFALTNQLRTGGTDNLLSAGRALGVKRFVVQSNAAVPYARTGGPIKRETDAFDPHPPESMRETIGAISQLEQAVTAAHWAEAIVLRYGWFYGPGTSISLDPLGSQIELIRKRRFPIVGDGGGVWSFIHIEDAASATVAAIEGDSPRIDDASPIDGRARTYNIVDDEPAAVSAWLPALAAAVGAKPPRRVPRWVGRLAAGEVAVLAMTELRGASNEKAKRELDWQLRYPSWRQGFVKGLD